MARRRTDNEIAELTVEAIGFEGIAVARTASGMAVFIKGGAPGERVEAEIYRRKKSYAEARLLRIIEPSQYRVMPLCKHFGVCGGCSWQHLDYAAQIEWKHRQVKDCFERIAKIEVGEIEPTFAAPEIYGYRNKMEFSFGASRWLSDEEIRSGEVIERGFALGLHAPGRYDKVLDIGRCELQPERGNELLAVFRSAALRFAAKCYNERERDGFLRNLVIRSGGGETMLILVTRSPATDADHLMLDWFEHDFTDEFPDIQAIHAVNDTLSPIAQGTARIIRGSGYLTETISGVSFRISPFSFFQTNPLQTANFLDSIFEVGNINGSEGVIWDLYCGAGTISLPVAQRGTKRVIGIELSESSISDAKANAVLNGINNAEFYCEDLHRPAALETLRNLPAPDCVILDPPRAGIHGRVLEHLLAIAPPKIVYVSCNPATQARDCAILAGRYSVRRIRPVDMFPHTFHIESVALLERIE
ncbi:MAG: 23S rRNA (uracil(1939)-C(5))-methyltransferase RlmD [Bacteroidetes bacterium]|nr:23S rRNA (uracil(1939)-C(5))-methyltransferase RlmD [Bacteroidota bacterium]